ncbi:MAG: hypothetical protein OEQ18_15850 [Gammaproteobacteria bacterium]|nr:hypothetical protein [Gammaproteobacteria bacterium]
MDAREYERIIWDLKQNHKRELSYITTRLRQAAREQSDQDIKQFLIFGFVLGAALGAAAGVFFP